MKSVTKARSKQKSHPVEMRPVTDQHILKGRFSFMLGDQEGHPLWDKPLFTDNIVVTQGRSWVLQHIMSAQSANVSSQIISAIAIGTSTTVPTTSDVLLNAEISSTASGRMTNITETDNSTSSAPNVVWAASWSTAQGNTGTIGEFGVFNTSAASSHTMLAHATTATFSKTTSNTLTVSYSVSN